jgi:hypothetical protein
MAKLSLNKAAKEAGVAKSGSIPTKVRNAT